MATLKKKKKRKREEMERPDTMDYQEAMKDPAWDNERKWADAIMESNRRLGLWFLKLDELTKGEGSCFVIAVVQQLRREDIFDHLGEDHKQLARTMAHHLLRIYVKDFICRLKWNDPRVLELKEIFNVDQAAKAEAGEESKTWEEYWERMLVDTEWADGYFIRATAWYLNMEIQIMDTKCKKEEPHYTIDGDFSGEGCRETLYIGYVSGVHYQSLLLDYDVEILMSDDSSEEEVDIDHCMEENEIVDAEKNLNVDVAEEKDPGTESQSSPVVQKDKEKDDERCPSCRKTFKKLLMHITRSNKCSLPEASLRKLEERSKLIKREKVRNRFQKFWKKKKDEDHDELKKRENEKKAKSRKKLRNEDYGGEKGKIRECTAASRQKLKESDPKAFKAQTKKDNESKKLQQDKSEVDRLRRFQEATMYGPLFVCVSCHGKMFRCSVKILTNRIVDQICQKIPVEECIDFDVVTKVVTESRHVNFPPLFKKNVLEVGERFICETCLRYLKEGKLPPKSFKNSLELHNTDAELKKEDLWLTELEGSLIAQNIVFQKIYQLPRSRWTGLKDKIINVPISTVAINNTLALLPRTPAQAGLIGISLKRRKEMKNTHKQQLINPDKIFRMLQKLKESGSPYHQNLMTPANYRILCNDTDKTGYETIYGEEEEDILEDLEEMPRFDLQDELTDEETQEGEESQDDESKKENNDCSDEDEEMKKKDPVRKYHFTYDESLCMMDKFPEISVAPGEGQRPKGILGDKHWDVKAFPHLHNPDGSNGKDQERKVKLRDQEYFIQRIINKEKRFAETPAYLYSAVAYLEEKRIQQSLSLVGSTGKEVKGDGGSVSYQLEDEFRVLETIPNSPKYWQRMKYEILAKIENLGPFHFFFTLSCADQRWDTNFATILSERGYEIMFIKTEVNGLPKTLVEVKTAKGVWKPLREFLDDDVADSKHELIRGNVVMATRYFHHRVKSFISKIVMSKSNPMHVKNYTWKAESQERGNIYFTKFSFIMIIVILICRCNAYSWYSLGGFAKD